MPPTYCEVALPVPLRNRAMTGVIVETAVRPPDPSRIKNIREIVEVLDAIPALPASLVDLGRWVAGYYVAPLGEVFRAMLPPEIDLRHEREFLITDAGRTHLAQLDAAGNRSESEV